VSAEAQTVHRSLLAGDPRIGWLGPGLFLAVALHLGVVAAAFFLPRFLDRAPPRRKPVIAHLVALGKPRDPHFLPRKESPPPAPAVAPASVPATSDAAPSRPAKAAPRQPTRQELMERALAGAARRSRDEKPDPDRAGQETGSPEGTAADAEEGDRYFSAVHDAILANYVVPSVISERERMYLSATVVAYIARDGSMVRHVLTKPSGNNFFDQALELAMQRTRLPAPPAELARLLRDEGVELNFRP